MNIIELAKEAGFVIWGEGERKGMIDWACEYDKELEKFAAIVRAETYKPYKVKLPTIMVGRNWHSEEIQRWLDELPPLYVGPVRSEPVKQVAIGDIKRENGERYVYTGTRWDRVVFPELESKAIRALKLALAAMENASPYGLMFKNEIAAIREALADHSGDANEMVADPVIKDSFTTAEPAKLTDEKGMPLKFWGGKAEPVQDKQ